MKRILLAALVISASIGSQVLSAATVGTEKVGALNFALTDTFQYRVYQNGILASNTVPALANCLGNVKYVTKTEKIDNKRIIAAIGDALGDVFTSKAQLAIVDYDNYIPAPPYPPYLVEDPTQSFNGPRDTDGELIPAMQTWPNEVQIDWVDYDGAITDPTVDGLANRWPKALVYISDPSNGSLDLRCVDVSAFWSFEEAYCYFCWDTIDRVTAGTLSTGNTTTGDICIGTQTQCGTKGSGTTKWYMTIKFNNDGNLNIWLTPAFGDSLLEVSVVDRLIFTVGGVVSYPWKIKPLNGVAFAFGTMTMSQANGYGQNPWCGVLTGSVKITETTDAKLPVCWSSNARN